MDTMSIDILGGLKKMKNRKPLFKNYNDRIEKSIQEAELEYEELRIIFEEERMIEGF